LYGCDTGRDTYLSMFIAGPGTAPAVTRCKNVGKVKGCKGNVKWWISGAFGSGSVQAKCKGGWRECDAGGCHDTSGPF